MSEFKVKINAAAKIDIQNGIKWYNSKLPGLGISFHQEVKKTIDSIRLTKFFQVRYGEVRCVPVRRFPFMIHFTVDEAKKRIVVRSVFHNGMDPNQWKKGKS